MVKLAVNAQPRIVRFVKTLYSSASFREAYRGSCRGTVSTMSSRIQNLFRPADRQAQERLAVLERDLDGIAQETSSRFFRGNFAAQWGLLESSEQLDASRELTIARRA